MSLFGATPEDLQKLDPNGAVDLIRSLIWADADATGIGKNLINVPSAINVNDGGIDGEVNCSPEDGNYGIIKKGITRYQIKSGKFSLEKAQIKDVLCDKTGNLKNRIKSCLDKNGTLVIIFTGWDNPDMADDRIKEKFEEFLIEISEKYKDANLEVWRQNTIRGMLINFPAIELSIRGIEGDFYAHDSWGKFEDMRPKIHLGEKQIEFINDIQSELRADGSKHLRTIGEPGIGKTRLIFEAVSKDDLKPIVIYCEEPENIAKMNFLNKVLLDDKLNMILIIDECNHIAQTDLWNKLKNTKNTIKLITIFNETNSAEDTEEIHHAPELNDEQLTNIINDYTGNREESAKWIDVCRPSPRAAHIIGQNLKSNPEFILKSPTTTSVWDRYIAGRTEEKKEVETRKTILLWISLFKRFGMKGRYANEANIIAQLIKDNEGIQEGTFIRTVEKLKRLKILQGTSTLYISPKILHVYLWTEWWRTYNESLVSKIISTINNNDDSGQLNEAYFKMFGYAKQSPEAKEITTKLLAPGGPFYKNEALKTQLGADFFLTLSRTDETSALKCLERIIKNQSREELLEFTTGRREVVFSLERMTRSRESFERAADVLLTLAEAENELYSNNATGVFCDLFVPGTGEAARTEVAPKDRIPILIAAINSKSTYKQDIGIEACSRALKKTNITLFTSNMDVFDKHPKLWTPESDREIIEYYQMILDLLVEKIESDEKNRGKISKIILDNLRYMISISKLDAKMLEIIRKLHTKHYLNSEELIEKITEIINYERNDLEPDTLKELQDLQDNVTGTDFHSLMKRYVGMNIRIDWSDETKDVNDPRKVEIGQLVAKARNPENLKPELYWLVTGEAKYGYVFGYELAKKDTKCSLLPLIMDELKARKDRGTFFIGGYLKWISENDHQKWEQVMEKIYDDAILCEIFPEIIFRTMLTDKMARKMINGINEKKFGYEELGRFGYGSATKNMSDGIFTEWIQLLVRENDLNGILIAMNMFHSYLIHRKQKPLEKSLTLEVLLHDNLIQPQTISSFGMMDNYYWKEIGLAFVKQYPKESIEVVKTVIENMDKENFFEHFESYVYEVLNKIVTTVPGEIWKIVAQYIGPPIDKRAYHIQRWLRGGINSDKGIMSEIPIQEIVAWAEKDKERPGYIARFLPTDFVIIREFLARYGDQEQVCRHIAINFNNESWSGSAVTHYEEKRKKFEKLKQGEDNKNVLAWLDYYTDTIEQRIKESMEMEERELQIF